MQGACKPRCIHTVREAVETVRDVRCNSRIPIVWKKGEEPVGGCLSWVICDPGFEADRNDRFRAVVKR